MTQARAEGAALAVPPPTFIEDDDDDNAGLEEFCEFKSQSAKLALIW